MHMFNQVDQIQTLPDRTISAQGGSSKFLFLMTGQYKALKFESAPLNGLLQEIFDYFRQLYTAKHTPLPKKTKPSQEAKPGDLYEKFKTAYFRPEGDWPTNIDWVPDQYPPRTTEPMIQGQQLAINTTSRKFLLSELADADSTGSDIKTLATVRTKSSATGGGNIRARGNDQGINARLSGTDTSTGSRRTRARKRAAVDMGPPLRHSERLKNKRSPS